MSDLDLDALRGRASMHEHYSRNRDMELPSSVVLALIGSVDELSTDRDSWRSRAERVSEARNLLHVENETTRHLNRDLTRTGTSLTARAVDAETRVAAVRELHKPVAVRYHWREPGITCGACMGTDPYPCPTITALDGTS